MDISPRNSTLTGFIHAEFPKVLHGNRPRFGQDLHYLQTKSRSKRVDTIVASSVNVENQDKLASFWLIEVNEQSEQREPSPIHGAPKKVSMISLLLYRHSGAACEMIRVRPKDYGLNRIGHFGFFRHTVKETLWKQLILPRLATSKLSY